MTRGFAAIVVFIAVVSTGCRSEVATGPCSFSNPERVFTLGNRVYSLDLPVARQGEGSNEILLLTGPAAGDRSEVLRLDLTTGVFSNGSMPYDASGKSWPYPGYTFWSGSILAPTHPLVQHGILRAVFDGRTFKRKRVAVWDAKFKTIDKELFTGTRRVMFGGRPLARQNLTNFPAGDQSLEGVHIEPDGDRILCFCNDHRGTNVGVFSRSRLSRAEPAAAGVESFASYAGEVSDRGEDANSDGFFDAIVVTPRIRVTRAGTYRVHVRLRNAKREQFMAFSHVNLAETAFVPVRFGMKFLTEALGQSSPYEIFAVEVSRDTPKGAMLLDQRFHAGQTHEYKLSELPQGFVVATGKGSAETIDADGDGKFERLRITVELEFARAGEHAVSATLRDDARRGIDAEKIVQQHITPGRHAITLDFSGAKIAKARMAGEYTLKLVVYGPATPAEIEKAFVTQSFLATDFE